MLTCCVEQLILPGMEAHPGLLGMQMAATACLYNLTKENLVQKINPNILKQVVELTLIAMENFPRHYQVSTFLNLCSWLPVPASTVCSSMLPFTQHIESTVKLSEEVFVKVQQIWLINPLALKACYS
jgi:hypothetical protein